MKIYLDDVRETPDGWFRTYTPWCTIAAIDCGVVTEVSLDHDLGNDEEIGTGYDVLLWLEKSVREGTVKCPVIRIHSANISARHKMQMAIDSINAYIELNQIDKYW